ncbi:MAG: hypothetical protein AABX11_01485 [Nanoarchaeota archaeon]
MSLKQLQDITKLVEMPNARNTFNLSESGLTDFENGVRELLGNPKIVIATYGFDVHKGEWKMQCTDMNVHQSDITRTPAGLVFSRSAGFYVFTSSEDDSPLNGACEEFNFLINGAPKFAFLRNLKNRFSPPGVYMSSQGDTNIFNRGEKPFPAWRKYTSRKEIIIYSYAKPIEHS